ncbi:hypothetical protein BCR34DRAFT_491981 [Clohesyomyces aquaticus]|uniref:Shugoshin n=1 Tax=Clohesyomyces aquaticus TaxID=1231657 RepID=A0A1Y1Z1F2_9PLEO|nr:hypothetical protein BCR34DRAFT_491981 [Clohesyomyces aquaticus]
MARLNEPPPAPGPSAETVDIVKRRFLRQNRELAKTNSQQSIRIRNLESEGSRLLAENLTLREQVLQLQNALESHSNRPSFENIDAVKDRLEAKVQELGGLIAELGQLQKPDTRPRCKSQTAATRRSPDERQWRSGLGLQEVENAMLPTIAEDKFYPRKTMNAEELRGILEDPDSQSPDLGPPPISRFEDEEPIAFDPSPSPETTPEEQVEVAEPALSSNLETRRKRRESNPKISIRRISVFESPPETSDEGNAKTVRAGAKRKLSVREDEEKPGAGGDSQQEPFRFSRKNAPSSNSEGAPDQEARQRSPERPALASKPVNTDTVMSPKKQRNTLDKLEKKPLLSSRSTRGRLTITRNTTQQDMPSLRIPTEPAPTEEIHLDSLPPKTPAAEDIFSPPSTEPSTSRPESKDTPPPGDLTSGDQNGLSGRPSRRARAQVSYKEPSLAAKMRRPSEKLVDAVYPHSESKPAAQPPIPGSGNIIIKRESVEGSGTWSALPLRDDGEVGSPLREKLGRREGSGGQGTESVTDVSDKPRLSLNSSAASNAISALINGSAVARKKNLNQNQAQAATTATSQTGPDSESKHLPSSTTRKQGGASATEQPVSDDLAIFDFKDSSPNEASASATANARPRIDLAKSARGARRHSAVPISASVPNPPEDRKAEPKTKAASGALPSLHTRTGSGARNVSFSINSGQGQGQGKSSMAAKAGIKERERERERDRDRDRDREKEKKTGSGLPTSSSLKELKDAEMDAASASLRTERAASRRKSMML